MSRKVSPLLSATSDGLRQFGASLRLARLRRGLRAKHIAERAGMAPITLRQVERGADGVTMGAYLAVMQVLGLEKEFLALAKTDTFGRELQDAKLMRSRAANRRRATDRTQPDRVVSPNVESKGEGTNESNSTVPFITVEELTALIVPARAPR